MPPLGRALAEVAVLLASLVAVALLAPEPLASVLAAVLTLIWAVAGRGLAEGAGERPGLPVLLVRLIPIVIALLVADRVADGAWFAVVAVAIGLPLTLALRTVLTN